MTADRDDIDTGADAGSRRDPHLLAALRHAPDHDVRPPPALASAILAQARASAQARMARPSAETPVWRWIAQAWAWMGQPAAAGALGSVLLAGVIALVWRDGVPPEAVAGAEAPAVVPAAPPTQANRAEREPAAAETAVALPAAPVQAARPVDPPAQVAKARQTRRDDEARLSSAAAAQDKAESLRRLPPPQRPTPAAPPAVEPLPAAQGPAAVRSAGAVPRVQRAPESPGLEMAPAKDSAPSLAPAAAPAVGAAAAPTAAPVPAAPVLDGAPAAAPSPAAPRVKGPVAPPAANLAGAAPPAMARSRQAMPASKARTADAAGDSTPSVVTEDAVAKNCVDKAPATSALPAQAQAAAAFNDACGKLLAQRLLAADPLAPVLRRLAEAAGGAAGVADAGADPQHARLLQLQRAAKGRWRSAHAVPAEPGMPVKDAQGQVLGQLWLQADVLTWQSGAGAWTARLGEAPAPADAAPR